MMRAKRKRRRRPTWSRGGGARAPWSRTAVVETLEERRLLASGARVLTHVPQVLAAEIEALSSIRLTFDKTVLASTFGPEDVVLKAPDGRRIEPVTITSPSGRNDRHFDVSFADQYQRGTYRIQVGPVILDVFGNWMDQNGNQANGEGLQDAYRATLRFAATTVPVSMELEEPLHEGFEGTTAMASYWSVETLGTGVFSVSSEDGPHSGSGHLVSTASLTAQVVQAATLVTEFTAPSDATEIALVFWAKGISGDDQSLVVEFSGDGEQWHEASTIELFEEYTDYVVDVRRIASAERISLDGPVFIRFRHVATGTDQKLALDDVRFSASDLFGPYVVSHSPGPIVAEPGPLDEFVVKFNEPIDRATFDLTDAQLKNESGQTVVASSVVFVPSTDDREVRLQFPPQTVRGDYRLIVGPQIADRNGNLMNQDRDSKNGEVGDVYGSTVTYRGLMFVPELLHDVNQTPFGALPSPPVQLGNGVIFTAQEQAFGRELWIADFTGGPARMLMDLAPGQGSGVAGGVNPPMANVGGNVFFAGVTELYGQELWKTDGTANGTSIVKDIRPGESSSEILQVIPFDNLAYFTVNVAAFGNELWRSDGTQEGTIKIADGVLAPTPGEDFLFFVVDKGPAGRELWRSERGKIEPVFLKELATGQQPSTVPRMVTVGDTLYFTNDEGRFGVELWKSTGRGSGTALLRDITSGDDGSHPDDFTVVGRTVFFTAYNNHTGRELWKTDGTRDGTVMVTDLRPGDDNQGNPLSTFEGSSGQRFAPLPDGVLFAAFDDLWRSDGTDEGTLRATDIRFLDPENLRSTGDQVFFSGTTSSTGRELWVSDGTMAGTRLFRNIAEDTDGALGSDPKPFGVISGSVFLAAVDGPHGPSLWKTDGTEKGTFVVKRTVGTLTSRPAELTFVGGHLYWSADDDVHQTEPWISDGRPGGTRLLDDIAQRGIYIPPILNSHPDSFTQVGYVVFFSATAEYDGNELFRTDGTRTGTRIVKDIYPGLNSRNFPLNSSPSWLTNFEGTLFFTADDGEVGRELWKSDGTAAGTMLVKDIRNDLSGAGSHPSELVVADGTLYFTADDGVHGRELWMSDGTTSGTKMVKDIVPGQGSSGITDLTVLDYRVFFTADDGTNGRELWITSGTPGTTYLLEEFAPGPAGSNPEHLTLLGDTVFFTAEDPVYGRELYKSGGRTSNTSMVLDLREGPAGSAPTSLTVFDDLLFFVADDGISGRELWRTTGTRAGTRQVADMVPGAGDAMPSDLVAVGETIYFVADDGLTGRELWQSDGTPAGTFLILDILLGAESSDPQDLTSAGDVLYFTADNLIHGREVWRHGPGHELLAGDFNNSGSIEQGDLDLVLLNWGGDLSELPSAWAGPPPSGAIDQEELDAVLLNWGNSTVGSAATSSPPAPAALLHAVDSAFGGDARFDPSLRSKSYAPLSKPRSLSGLSAARSPRSLQPHDGLRQNDLAVELLFADLAWSTREEVATPARVR